MFGKGKASANTKVAKKSGKQGSLKSPRLALDDLTLTTDHSSRPPYLLGSSFLESSDIKGADC
jgi:hypothetical protein